MTSPSRPKLPRAERREQILAAATVVFADAGYAATGLMDIAAAAGISRMILYRHFESKTDLFRAAIDRAGDRLARATGEELTETTVHALVTCASEDAAAFRLLFHQAAREPEFRHEIDELREEMVKTVHRHLAEVIPDQRWARWAAQLSLTVVIEAIMTWLDVGRPEPHKAARRINQAVDALISTVQEN